MALSTEPITIQRISIREKIALSIGQSFKPPDSFVLFVTTGGLDYRKALRYGKTGNKKRATCLATFLQNKLICCKTGLMWVVKLATSLFCSFAAMLQDKLHVFCCPFFRTFTSDNYFEVLFGPIFVLSAKIETKLFQIRYYQIIAKKVTRLL